MKAMSLRIRMQTQSPGRRRALQSAGDAAGTLSHLGMASAAIATDDAEEELVCIDLSC